MAKILIIEDDLILSKLIQALLESKDHFVDIENDGKSGLDRATANDYSLILLDLSLPTLNGLQILSELRKNKIKTPVIIVTGDVSDESELKCYRTGTNLFHKKPIKSRLLMYQIESLIRENPNSIDKISYKDIQIDELNKDVSISSVYLQLTKLEYELFRLLVRQNSCIVSKDTIISTLYYEEEYVLESSIDTTISRLRSKIRKALAQQSKLDPKTEIIITSRGFGYKIY